MPLTLTLSDNENGSELIATVDPTAGTITEVTVRSTSGITDYLTQIDIAGLVKALAPQGLGLVSPMAPAPAPAPAKKAARKTPAARKTATAKTAGPKSRRPYREMPEDFAAKVDELGGSQTILAKHYKVPGYTVAGWLRRHRKEVEATATATTQ